MNRRFNNMQELSNLDLPDDLVDDFDDLEMSQKFETDEDLMAAVSDPDGK